MKLYRVTCRGMTTGIAGGDTPGVAYVVAPDASGAYKRLRARLDKDDIGFAKDRVLDKVELLAEEDDYPECGVRLFA